MGALGVSGSGVRGFRVLGVGVGGLGVSGSGVWGFRDFRGWGLGFSRQMGG